MNNEIRDEVVYLHLDDIIPNRFQPREVFDERALKELAVSIKEHGVIQPIIVRRVNGKYEIIAGERRYKASALAGLTKIPAIVRDLDDKESSKVALLENLQRKNLNVIEEARTCQKILELDQLTQEELAKTLGKSQSAIANKLRLLSLPDDIQDALLKEQISERHARALLNVENPKTQKELLKKIINNKMSVRALEEEINSLNSQNVPNKEINSMDNNQIQINPSYINSNPLKPANFEMNKENEIGTVTIVPPEGMESQQYKPKFINYGEVSEDDENQNQPTPMAASTNVDINTIKNNAQDINAAPAANKNASSLDSLLNINSSSAMPEYNTPNNNPNNNFTSNFITPAEAIVKSDINNSPETAEKDYFAPPDFKSINLPLQSAEPIKESVKYDLPSAISKLKSVTEEIKQSGINIQFNELDFDKSYQIIIKITKE